MIKRFKIRFYLYIKKFYYRTVPLVLSRVNSKVYEMRTDIVNYKLYRHYNVIEIYTNSVIKNVSNIKNNCIS